MSRQSGAREERQDPEFRHAIDALSEYRQVNKTQIARAAGLAVSGLKRAYAGKGSMTSLKVAAICRPFGVKRSEFWKWGEDRHALSLKHTLEMEKRRLQQADPEAIDLALARLIEVDAEVGKDMLMRHLTRLDAGLGEAIARSLEENDEHGLRR